MRIQTRLKGPEEGKRWDKAFQTAGVHVCASLRVCVRGMLPGHTPGLRGREANPRRARLSHSPVTTCLWPQKMAGPK